MPLTSKDYLDKIINQKIPDKWTVPKKVQNSLKDAQEAAKLHTPEMNATMQLYAVNEPVTRSQSYQKLVDMYNKEYDANAALAAAEAVKASESMNAGYGDSYSKAATGQAYSDYMSERGGAYPSLMTVAADAVAQDKAALAAGIGAMNSQRSATMSTAQDAFSNLLSQAQKKEQSEWEANKTMKDSLGDLYAYAKSLEGGSSGSGRSSGGGYKITDNDQTPLITEEDVNALRKNFKSGDKDYYSEAVKKIKKLGGNPNSLMTPQEFSSRNKSNQTYTEYVQSVVNSFNKQQKRGMSGAAF